YLSGHSDSGDQRRVAVHRPAAGPDERPHHDSVRARAHHDGERYRAHRRRLTKACIRDAFDIEHIEGVSYAGFGVVKIFFQPTADIRTANAQVTSVSQTQLKLMPAG